MKGGCERASPSPADKRTPKILTRPRAARSPGPDAGRSRQYPHCQPRGPWGDRGAVGSSAGCSLITFRAGKPAPRFPRHPGEPLPLDPRQGNCRSAFKEHGAGGRAVEGGPSLPSWHLRQEPCPPDPPQGEPGGGQRSSPRRLHSSSTVPLCLSLQVAPADPRPGTGSLGWGTRVVCRDVSALSVTRRSVLTPHPWHPPCSLGLPPAQFPAPGTRLHQSHQGPCPGGWAGRPGG